MTLIMPSFSSPQHELAALRQEIVFLQQQVDQARLAERRSHANAQCYRKILDALPNAVFLQAADSQVLYGNKAFHDRDAGSDNSLFGDNETIQWLETIAF